MTAIMPAKLNRYICKSIFKIPLETIQGVVLHITYDSFLLMFSYAFDIHGKRSLFRILLTIKYSLF